MYDPMWEDHIEDLFEEITEKEALSDSIYEMYPGILPKLWALSKSFANVPLRMAINKYPKPIDKAKSIKFRRYYTGADLPTEDIFEGESNGKEKMVRESECETDDTLGTGRKIGSVLPCHFSRPTDNQDKHAKACLEATEISHGNGPAFPEG